MCAGWRSQAPQRWRQGPGPRVLVGDRHRAGQHAALLYGRPQAAGCRNDRLDGQTGLRPRKQGFWRRRYQLDDSGKRPARHRPSSCAGLASGCAGTVASNCGSCLGVAGRHLGKAGQAAHDATEPVWPQPSGGECRVAATTAPTDGPPVCVIGDRIALGSLRDDLVQ